MVRCRWKCVIILACNHCSSCFLLLLLIFPFPFVLNRNRRVYGPIFPYSKYAVLHTVARGVLVHFSFASRSTVSRIFEKPAQIFVNWEPGE